MPCPFTVETGATTATSYCSVEAADDIIGLNLHASPAWTAITVGAKQRLLGWATMILDTHVRWPGTKATPGSALRWPRSGVIDRDGCPIPANVIPVQVQTATALLALALVAEDRTAEGPQAGVASVRAESVQIDLAPGYRRAIIPAHVATILRDLGTVPGTGIGQGQVRR